MKGRLVHSKSMSGTEHLSTCVTLVGEARDVLRLYVVLHVHQLALFATNLTDPRPSLRLANIQLFTGFHHGIDFFI